MTFRRINLYEKQIEKQASLHTWARRIHPYLDNMTLFDSAILSNEESVYVRSISFDTKIIM